MRHGKVWTNTAGQTGLLRSWRLISNAAAEKRREARQRTFEKLRRRGEQKSR
jgi:hypothetical protein